MKITIIGDGAFGGFLKELLSPHCEITKDADTVILAVPSSAYEECGLIYGRALKKHLVNVCSVQSSTTKTLLKYTDRITSIHPLFGKRTPSDKRNSIVTHEIGNNNDTWLSEDKAGIEFMELFGKVSKIIAGFTPESHDLLMAKTHVAAVMAAKQLKVFTDRVKDIPDEVIPNSFRLMRQFVQTLEDMPQGTIESIMSNPYV